MSDKPTVREHVTVQGYRCPHCEFPAGEDEIEGSDRMCPNCGECELEPASLDAVMLSDGRGPLICCDCRHHA